MQLSTRARDAAGAPLFTPTGVPVSVCAQMSGSQDLSGAPRAYAPEWSGNLAVHAEFPLDEYHRLTIDPVVYFKSDHYLSAEFDPILFQESFAKVDLRVALASEEGWDIAVLGRNLTDEVTGSFASAVTGANGSARYLVDRPRSFALQFSYGF